MDRMPPRANNGLSSARPVRPTPEPIDEPVNETPKPVAQPQLVRPERTTPRHEKPAKVPRKKRRIIIAAIIAAVLLIAIAAFALLRQPATGAAIDGGKYQAVFFTNGQVYFGKLAAYNGSYMKLTNVFYLQSKTDSADDSKNPQKTQSQDSSDVQLIKLGNEIHGPDDEMLISKEQILFFENLKKDGKVASTISQYQSQPAK